MKKKIFGAVLMMAIIAVAAFNTNVNLGKSNKLSALALSNVEALADSELLDILNGIIEEYKKPQWLETTCVGTKFEYDSQGRLSNTITYSYKCCTTGSKPCTI